MLNLIQPAKNAAQNCPQLFLPIFYVIDFSFKDGTMFIYPPGNLIDIIAQAAHETNRIMQLRQIQLQHISVQGHGSDKCRLVFDPEGFHLFLNEGILFRCRLEAVLNRAVFLFCIMLEGSDHHFMGYRWGNSGSSVRLFFWAPKSLQMVTAAMKLKDAYSLALSSSHVWM